MSMERGRIQISGFDTERVTERESLSDWMEETGESTESRWRRAWRRFRANRSAMIGLVVVGIMSVLTLLAEPIVIAGVKVQPISLALHDPNAILWLNGYPNVEAYSAPIVTAAIDSWTVNLFGASFDMPWLHINGFPFGTDNNARDMYSRVIFGGRYSLSIGFVVVFITATIGIVYGSISGYYGGKVDEVMMRILDIIFAFPGLILALVVVAMLGKGYWQLVAAFSIFGWAGYARLIRGEILSVKENEYVLAAKALGAKDRSVIFRHIVPNALTPVIVQASLAIGTVVIGVAALGFLGLGFASGTPEWGTMLDQTRATLIQGPGQTLAILPSVTFAGNSVTIAFPNPDAAIPWWATVFPGGAIFLFVMAMNLIGDGINDALDAQEDIIRGGGG
jgi:peptide/nickel transport system permease protein